MHRQRRELTLKTWEEEEDVAKTEEEAMRQEESRRGWSSGSQQRSPTRKGEWPTVLKLVMEPVRGGQT